MYRGNAVKKSNKKLKKYSFLIIICITIFIYLHIQNNWIKVENFLVERNDIPQEFDGFKIVHISDVHLPKNASDVNEIISLVKKQSPDIIIMTGDIIDESADIWNCKLDELCKGLSEICDVYAVTGNHEVWNGNLDLWNQILTENNIRIVDDTFEIIERNQKQLVISGLSDNTPYSPEIFEYPNEIAGLFHIMLAHRPELFNTYSSSKYSISPSIVFSGHAHGGQFRIPFVGGLVAPDQGLFPSYTSGIYLSENNVMMIVSRGIGNSIVPFRINNRPHLLVITLILHQKT